MEQFDIIGALETYALSQNWKFEYGVDAYYRSIQAHQEYQPGELIMIADFRAQPTYGRSGMLVTPITYTCLVMLGRKFDSDGQTVSLDETNQQKYDRRLRELVQMLANAIGNVACNNELEVSTGEIVVQINEYADNLDFAVSANTVFVQ